MSFRRSGRADASMRIDLEHARGIAAAANADCSRLQAAFDALPLGVVLVDQRGAATLRNSAADVGHGAHVDVLVAEALDRLLAQALNGVMSEQVVELHGPPRFVAALQARPIPGGGAVGIIEDISERSRLDAVRTDFVANMSHELKTPVGALAVLAETIVDANEPEITRRLSERMVEEAHRVARTVDELLELSRIELAGERVVGAVSIAEIVADAVERSRFAADQRSVTIRPDCVDDLFVTGDHSQLVSAVANLVENAAKYSEDGSDVTVTARPLNGSVQIVVSDQGMGIPARDLDRIFERFYRVDRARSRGTGGTGLGLSIVRHVASNHAGTVTVKSHEGEGSVFTLTLPLTTHDLPAGTIVHREASA